MKFVITQEISGGLGRKSQCVSELSIKLKAFFSDKTYGEGLAEIYVSFVCVSSEFEFFYSKKKKKYAKNNRILEYDLNVNFQEFLNIKDYDAEKYVFDKVIESLVVIKELKIPKFDFSKFIEDINQLKNE